MVIVGFVLVLGFGAVITNLVRLQLVNGETLKTDAVDQSLQSTQLTPSRGTIYDATGTKVLAQSASVWTVALEPNYIDEGDDVKIAKGLSEILGLDYDAVLKKAQQNSYFVYVKRKVETEVRDEIVQYIKDEKIGRGITLMEDYKRYYPYGTTASTVLGFTGTDNQGLAGIETEYDSELTGTAGRLVSAKNAQGDDMPFQYDQYVQAQDGYDLVLTIDETVQSMDTEKLDAAKEAARRYNEQLGSALDRDAAGEAEDTGTSYVDLIDVGESLGYITIPKIDVNLPIYEGTSDDVLLKGVGHLEGSSYPLGGESTHSVLTGHRGLAEAVLFTDLDKLQEGDKFYLHIMDEVLAYQVDQVKVVLPEETDDLTIVQGQDYCTLVTCTPYAINTHRMLVRGIRVPYNGEEENGDTPQVVQYQALHTGTVVKRIVDAWPWISVTGSVIIGGEALLLLLLLHRCKKREEDD